MFSYREKVKKILAGIDVSIDGNRDWDIQVHDERLYWRVITGGSIGLGEAYMDGWWDCQKLDDFFSKILGAQLNRKVGPKWKMAPFAVRNALFNMQSVSRAFQVGERHYDIGNDLYKAMLDKRMVYTCGYWSGNPPAGGLDEAQENKLDLVCRKLGLRSGQKVLDIGCGWGSFAKYAAEKYGVSVVGVTISKEQVSLGEKMCKGLPVEIKLQDYRKIEGKFDHIVSLGMFEHVGYKNYRTYMNVAGRSLKDGGLFLLHTIGGNISTHSADPWMKKYIFPNGMLPSIKQIGAATEGLFVMEDWHNFRADYDKTLMEWFKNFDSAWPILRAKYGDRFYRMWKYYLLSCAGAFRAKKMQLWQIVLSKNGVPEGYKSIR